MQSWRRWTPAVLGGLLLAVLGWAPATAQSIRGTVTDSTDQRPLEGAVVSVIGTNKRVATGANGEYALSDVAPGTIAVRVQMIGYAPGVKRVALAAGDEVTLDFALSLRPIELEELVAIGYGTVQRDNLSTAVSTVSAEDISGQANASADAALQGRAPGVQVIQNAGNPGNAISVRVRGTASISASNQPLYVVDGVPMLAEDFSQLGLGGQGIRAVTGLSPEDIASIDVLKDAASASIYGSRGSNGVVLITTKRGQEGKGTVTFNSYVGTQSISKKLNLLNGPEYLEYMREAAANDGYDPDDWFPTSGINTDWQDAVTRTAPITSMELAASGGSDRIRYRVAGSWFDQEGIVLASGYRRIGGRVNLDFQATPRLFMSAGLGLSGELNDRIEADDNLEGIVGNAIAAEPYVPVRQPDGSFTPSSVPLTYPNAVHLAKENTTTARTSTTLGNVEARYDFGRGLQLTGRVGVDLYNLSEEQFQSPLVPNTSGSRLGGVAKRGYSNAQRYVFDAYMNFDRAFGERHQLNLTAGTSLEKTRSDNNFITGEVLTDPKLGQVNNATNVTVFSGTYGENGLVSYFGRANYSLDEKYLLGLSFRSDGASVFGTENRYGFFPGASLAWVANREGFLAGNKSISLLKLRTSLGRTGNQGLGNYPYQSTFCTSNYGDEAGYYPCRLGNPELGWEKTTQLDLGFDLELWNGRAALAFDWYHKKTSDLLLSRPVPGSTGFVEFTDNIGGVTNKGVEFMLTVVPVQPSRADGFRALATLNMSFNRNKVTELYGSQPFSTGYYDFNRVAVGRPLGEFHAYKFLGVDPQTGDAQYEDRNNDGVITTEDKTFVGTPWPDFTGGLTTSFSWKRFDLTGFFQFSQGNQVFNAMRQFADDGGYNYDNKFREVLTRWQNVGDRTNQPRASFDDLSNARFESDRWIEDASYIRLQDLTIGYQLPENVAASLRLAHARVYLRGQNVFTSTDYSGFNPEVNSNGLAINSDGTTTGAALATDFYAYPVARTWSFGIQAGW